MTTKTRERLNYLLVSTLIITGTVLYVRRWDLENQWGRYKASVQATKEMHKTLRDKEQELATAQQRANDMDKDPVEKEATVRRVSKGVREDELVFRVEEEPSPAQK